MALKIVDFGNWCGTCEFCEKDENETPCHECLSVPAREDSRKPDRYIERTSGKKSRKES